MNILKKQYVFIILSLSISMCFIFNAFGMCLKNYDICFNNGGVGNFISDFFTVTNVSNDIVSSMMCQTDVAGNKINNAPQDDNVFDIVFIPIGQTFKSAYKNIKNELKNQKYIVTDNLSESLIDYPLKIPFWQFIFFILLFRMLFNVLPRSISVNYIMKYMKACALS